MNTLLYFFFFFSSRRRHTRLQGDWSSDVCSSDLILRHFPHVTNEIKAAMKKVAQDVDVVIVEVGGTVGDIESLPFMEAIRQMRQELGREHTLFVHVTLVPFIAAAQELKTKPTQHSVKELLSIGIQPDMLLCRTDRFLSKEIKSKIALFCNVEEEAVITAKDVA